MINRDQFMEFFRCDNFHELISPSDAEEIFLNVLHGASDITADLLNDLLNDYGIYSLKVEVINA